MNQKQGQPQWKRWLRWGWLCCVVLYCFSVCGEAQMLVRRPPQTQNFYLDPNWGGATTGAAATPWTSLDSAAWTTINAALSISDVTIYCSARQAASDTDDIWDATVLLSNRITNPTHRLTFNGRSQYNTNETTPAWGNYSGSSRCRAQAFIAQNSSHIKYSNITIDGFRIRQSTASKAVSICGDDVTLTNSDVFHTSGATNGNTVLILIVPSADGAHDGSSDYCPAMTRLTISNNTLHDSDGELIYLGGAGCSDNNSPTLSNSTCGGFPSHSNITISGNTIYNCGIFGDEGDCLDVKAAITQLTVSNNDFSHVNAVAGSRALVMQGIQTDNTDQQILIERNTFHDSTNISDANLTLVNSWGTPNGITIRNNVFRNNAAIAVEAYDSQAVGVFLYNNTFYSQSSYAIATVTTATNVTTIRNNAILSNNGGGNQNSLKGTLTVSHNAYAGTWDFNGSTCTTSCNGSLTGAAFTNAAGGDLTLASGSVLLDVAITLSSFANDLLGISRPQGSAWDIGAYERP